MSVSGFTRALIGAFLSRSSIVLIFWLVTLIVCVQAMFKSSAMVGASALVACALCYAGASGFMGSLIARREKNYSTFDLMVMGVIALVIIAAGSALMIWSGFRMSLFNVGISGVTWALLGAVSAVVVVRKEDAL
jgi:hypothetical protein